MSFVSSSRWCGVSFFPARGLEISAMVPMYQYTFMALDIKKAIVPVP